MRTLVIDDNSDIADVVCYYCESEHIECDSIKDGRKGLAAIRKSQFDLILVDLEMPEFGGLDIINNLKTDHILEKMNIVVFTASSDDNVFEEIQKSGIKEILRKPFSIDELEKVMSRYRPKTRS